MKAPGTHFSDSEKEYLIEGITSCAANQEEITEFSTNLLTTDLKILQANFDWFPMGNGGDRFARFNIGLNEPYMADFRMVLEEGGNWELIHRFIDPKNRKQGLGTFCMDCIEESARRIGTPEIRIDVSQPIIGSNIRGIQAEMLKLLISRGYLPEDAEAEHILELIQQGLAQTEQLFVKEPQGNGGHRWENFIQIPGLEPKDHYLFMRKPLQ